MWNIFWQILLLIYISEISTIVAYDTPSGPQYHIQTDEGPERYFKYQTLSGQYRKEKRLEDGTVIGTYAWIDNDGMLIQRDYIADKAGYRILKSKNIYVGRNMPIENAMKIAKKYPANAGTLVSGKSRPAPRVRPTVSIPYSTTIAPPIEISVPSSTPGTILSSTVTPLVEISNNALPSSTGLPAIHLSSTERPYVEITPHSISSVSGFSTTLAPERSYSSTSQPFVITPADTFLPGMNPKFSNSFEDVSALNEPSQSLDYNPYVSSASENRGYYFQNGPTYPIDRNGNTYRGSKRYVSPRIGNGYDKQYEKYDGVSVTNDGFRYYIPRAYHEEQSTGDEKEGSFGYIDPFGIRRVIYYNAKPGQGFQHQKNNRYVGFDATPYDPRPY